MGTAGVILISMKSKNSTSESILEKLDEIEVKLEYAKNRLDDLILAKRKQNAEMAQWLKKMKVRKQHATISL